MTVAVDPNRLMAAGYPPEVKQLIQQHFELEQAHQRLLVVVARLRADWEAEYHRAEQYKTLYSENTTYQERLRAWLEEAPHAP